MVIQGKYFYEQWHLIPSLTNFEDHFWIACLSYFWPQYEWFLVHLKGPLTPIWYETLVVNWQSLLFTLFHQSRSVLSPNRIVWYRYKAHLPQWYKHVKNISNYNNTIIKPAIPNNWNWIITNRLAFLRCYLTYQSRVQIYIYIYIDM